MRARKFQRVISMHMTATIIRQLPLERAHQIDGGAVVTLQLILEQTPASGIRTTVPKDAPTHGLATSTVTGCAAIWSAHLMLAIVV